MARLRLAPYARDAARRAKEGLAPSNTVVIAGDWVCSKWVVFCRSSWHALIPPDHLPDEYDWRWLAGFDVLVCARSKPRLEAILEAVANAKPSRLIGIRPNAPTVVYVAG